ETHVARSLSGNRKFFITDVEGTVNICNAVGRFANRIEKFIHISTSEVYGSAVKEPMDEDHPLLPETPYASAKAGADRAVFSFYRSFKIPAVIVRPFNNYGPHQHLEKFIPRSITALLLGEKIVLHGDGDAMRDWVFVDDTVDGIMGILDYGKKDILGEV